MFDTVTKSHAKVVVIRVGRSPVQGWIGSGDMAAEDYRRDDEYYKPGACQGSEESRLVLLQLDLVRPRPNVSRA